MGEVEGALTAEGQSADQVAAALAADPEDVFHLLTHLAANGKARATLGDSPAEDRFSVAS